MYLYNKISTDLTDNLKLIFCYDLFKVNRFSSEWMAHKLYCLKAPYTTNHEFEETRPS